MERKPLSQKSRHIALPLHTPFNFLLINSAPFIYPQSPTKVRYECVCTKCGNTTVVKYSHLNVTKSCGCLTKRQGPKICKVCSIQESDDNQFPSNRFLLCKKHEIEHNKSIRKKAHKIWRSKTDSTPIRFLKTRLHQMRDHRLGCTTTITELLKLWEDQQGKCAITGLTMVHQHELPTSLSVDRKNSAIGYHNGNIQLVCRCVNFAKNKYTNDQIIEFFDAYYKSRCNEKQSS